jgi:hypothetical protein
MLKRVVITNCYGESMEYKIDGVQANNPSGLIITEIEGLGPVKANINMTDLATTDGGLFNSARLSTRNIVIKGLFTHVTSIEEARLLSYKYFPIKKKLTFRIETDNRTAETTGYVESNEPEIFEEECSCQISVLCESAYFDGGKIGYTFGNTIPLLKFAFGNESLNEPLIKISENATPQEVNKIDYEGDTDAGVEFKVDLPSDDFTDVFNVTSMSISKENNEKMDLNFGKMSNLVPNTSPVNLDSGKCFFVYSQRKTYKFLGELPEATNGHSKAFFWNGVLHYCTTFNLYKWENTDWELVTTLPEAPYHIVVFRDNLYGKYQDNLHFLSGGSAHNIKHYVLNAEDVEAGFELLSDGSFRDLRMDRGSCVVFGDAIYVLGGSRSSAYGTNEYQAYIWHSGDASWTQLGNNMGSYARDSYDSVVVYHDKIHVFSTATTSAVTHYVFDGIDTWETKAERLPSSCSQGRPVVINDEIHIFGGVGSSGTGVGAKTHYKWNESTDTWTEEPSIPYYFYLAGAATDNTNVFLVGSDSSRLYTGDANNDHLIEDDSLVINTVKGKKSIYLYRGTNKYNVLNVLEKDPTWFELHRGANYFAYTAEGDDDKVKITIATNKWYEGV